MHKGNEEAVHSWQKNLNKLWVVVRHPLINLSSEKLIKSERHFVFYLWSLTCSVAVWWMSDVAHVSFPISLKRLSTLIVCKLLKLLHLLWGLVWSTYCIVWKRDTASVLFLKGKCLSPLYSSKHSLYWGSSKCKESQQVWFNWNSSHYHIRIWNLVLSSHSFNVVLPLCHQLFY